MTISEYLETPYVIHDMEVCYFDIVQEKERGMKKGE